MLNLLRAVSLMAVLFGGALAASPATAAIDFAATGSLSPGRYAACDVRLADGKVIIIGGYNGPALATAQIYYPATGQFTTTANGLSLARGHSTCTVLANGKILIAGGGADDMFDGSKPTANADLYDPATGMFTATGSMKAVRTGAVAALLGNGKVLVAGGIGADEVTRLASAELYDPTTGTFAFTGSLHDARDVPVSAVLPSGKVLITGGGNGSGSSLTSSELYDPALATFSLTGSMHVGRDDATATLLPNGKVLVVAGIDQDVALTSAELYDPATGIFTLSQSTLPARRFHSATLLPSGQVLIAGGVASDTHVNTTTDARLYDPATDTFAATGSMATSRFYHTATLLQNGLVLVAGGYNDNGIVSGAELYGVTLSDQIFKNGFEAP